MARREKKRAIWAEHVAAYAASGLTREAFCTTRGLKAHTLDGWRRRLREVAASPRELERAAPRAAARPTDAAPAAFVPLKVRKSALGVPSVATAAPLTLRVGDAVRVELPRDVDPAWLVALLRGLR